MYLQFLWHLIFCTTVPSLFMRKTIALYFDDSLMRWSSTFNSPPTCGEGVAGWTAVLWAVVDWELGALGWIFNQSAGHCAVVLEWQQSSNLNMSHCKSWEQKLTEFMATTPWPRKWLFMAANKFNFLVNNVKQFSSSLPSGEHYNPPSTEFWAFSSVSS